MIAYFDKEFLDNFFILYNEKDPCHLDFRKFLQNLRRIKVVLNFKDHDEFQEALNENPFYELLLNETVPEIEYCPNFKGSIDNPELYMSSDPFKVFFIQNDIELNRKLSKKYGYEIISSENLSQEWGKYYSAREDKRMKVTKNKSYPEHLRFDSWEKLLGFRHPLNSIIIIDRYVLTNAEGRQELEYNLFPMLKNFIETIPDETGLEILILTRNTFADLMSSYEFLIEKFKCLFPGSKIILNIIRDEKKLYPKGHHGIKGRQIITNYYLIEASDSFTYFNSNGSTKGISTISFNSVFEPQVREELMFEIQEMKDYIANLIEYDERDLTYYKSNKNRLLNF